MTTLLEKAFAEAAKLSPAEQDLLAQRLLAEVAEEDEFDRLIESTSAKLTGLAEEALKELDDGRTEPLDPERI